MAESPSRRRPYKLGKREASVAETRKRILDAAADAYRELGVSGTSMQEVARRADVAAGTVLNHFETPEDLTEAVVEHITTQLSVPTSDVLEGIDDPLERVRVTVEAVYAFYQRSGPWVEFFFRERGEIAAIAVGQEEVMGAIGDLMANALGPLTADVEIRIAVGAILDPATREALLRAGATKSRVATHAFRQVEPLLARALETER
jgi:AcrR family transcriptional regulator